MNIDIDKYQMDYTEASAKSEGGGLMELMNKDISIGSNTLPLAFKESFYTELEILLIAGLDLKKSLDLIIENRTKKKEVELITAIRTAVLQGASFSESMKATQQFTDYEIFSIQIAEESGHLAPILHELSAYFARALQYKRMMISALSYPILVLTVAMLSLVFLLNFLVPMFSDMYGRLNQELPEITVMIVNLSALSKAWMPTFFGCFLVVSFLLYFQREKTWFRKISAMIICRIPVFGPLITQIYLARFAQAMGFLLTSKAPLLQAIDLVKKMVGFYPIESSLEKIGPELIKGAAFYDIIKPYKIYPNNMKALIKVGEEANQLDNLFLKMANQFNQDVEQKTKMLGAMIEPVIIVFLALIVGLVLVSMYMPIFKLVSNFGG